jgi:recombination protein RecR
MNPNIYPPAMRQLINELSKLPSIGEKSAIRLAYHLITGDTSRAFSLAQAITQASDRTEFCKVCFALTENEICDICSDANRNDGIICVVEKPADIFALERSGGFRGKYHVLHGLWSPLRGVKPEDLKLEQLFERIQALSKSKTEYNGLQELIIATSTTVEGDATALFIANKAKQQFQIRVSRIAQGLPQGGELEYADELTISHAIEGRRIVDDHHKVI